VSVADLAFGSVIEFGISCVRTSVSGILRLRIVVSDVIGTSQIWS
jgi:hypothetical protein